MSLGRDADARQSVFSNAIFAVMAAGQQGTIVQAGAEADRLMREYPEAAVARTELVNYIIEFAGRERVPIEAG